MGEKCPWCGAPFEGEGSAACKGRYACAQRKAFEDGQENGYNKGERQGYQRAIDEIEGLEREITESRARANVVQPGRYAHERASFFQTQRQGFEGIRAVRQWSQTERGGKQFSILQPLPTGGCMRWGICESPTEKP